MRLIPRIMVAQDFTDSTRHLLHSAIELGKTFQSTVIPVHVLPDSIQNDKVNSFLKNTANAKLQESMEVIRSNGLEAGEAVLTVGTPYMGVSEAAIESDASLIVLGSGVHADKGVFKLGTTTERIIQESDKPVFVVKQGQSLNVKHVLCPVDFSETSGQALKNAITMAFRFKAKLTILNVSESEGSTWFASRTELDEIKTQSLKSQNEEFDKFISNFSLAGLDWDKHLLQGNPADVILNFIESNGVDLLVMGTVGRTGLNRLIMGSVTEKVIREVPCSFITIKSEDVIRVQLETSIADIQKHFQLAEQLVEDGLYRDAINQYKTCLAISRMHAPAYFGIAKVFEILNEPGKAKLYRNNGREILDRIWYTKIEDEVRKLRSH